MMDQERMLRTAYPVTLFDVTPARSADKRDAKTNQ